VTSRTDRKIRDMPTGLLLRAYAESWNIALRACSDEEARKQGREWMERQQAGEQP
jgi:hypothetical protein